MHAAVPGYSKLFTGTCRYFLKCCLWNITDVPCDLQITFANDVGKFDLEVTTFQMAVLFAWNQRPKDRVSYESLQLATELPDTELRKTLFVSCCILSLSFLSVIYAVK